MADINPAISIVILSMKTKQSNQKVEIVGLC